ncbi:class A beta-lactamase-related serine hydrolase [Rhodococcus sp. CH91]|uniref:class A beta-lactamase-related serine hydrolase n=1 Tax=Rhodococcus sp. CH91 TaxID=2910256 RepID=UPI001F4ADA16|nr:class A beta-lactamase-related serine hydrolase [Rhodococcus sp. CH91]
MKCRRGRARSGAMMLFVAVALVGSGCDSIQPQSVAHETLALGSAVDSDRDDSPDILVGAAGFSDRIDSAVALAADRRARLTVAVLDRETGARVLGGADEPFETASTVKLFIAEEVLRQQALQESVSDDDHELIRAMLRSSDDSAATVLWEAYGGPEIVEEVAERHALTGTAAPDQESWWWNTTTTASDLLTWYDDLLSSGATEQAAARIVGHLSEYTDRGVDGYDQRFGLPSALVDPADLGVKQGWMCCPGEEWLHLSTGFFGEDHRFVVVIAAREEVTYDESDPLYGTGFLPDTALYDATTDSSAQHARETVTMAAETILGTDHQR